MAAESGRTGARLSERLFQEPYRFDFFQAVRLLERLLAERAQGDPRQRRAPVGYDQPEQELVRFRAQNSLSFPPAPIIQIKQPRPRDPLPDGEPPPEMTVSFMGLTGPVGVMPHHYTALLLRRVREKDFSLRDFLDLFNHRVLSLFYRAWEKYRLPFAYERSRLTAGEGKDDGITRGLYCLVGMGTGGLRDRQEFADEAFLYYAGLFAHFPRSAGSLEGLLGDYFQLPIEVHQFQGRWLTLRPEDCTILPSSQIPQGMNLQLGIETVAGDRIWDIRSTFRIRVGPLGIQQFRSLMPSTHGLRALSQMVRMYVGPELDFDVQLVLRPAEVPACRLGSEELPDRPRLGWNTWIHSAQFPREVEDAVFAAEGA